MDYETVETTARVREWQYLTGADFEAMDRKRTVAIVSCSPLEVHGPHLPVITDNWEAEGISLRTMELLCDRHPDISFVHLPPIYVAADVVPQPGSVAFRPDTIVRVLEDLGRSLAVQGFDHIWVGSFHGGPRHFVPIELAAERVNKKYGVHMVSMFSLLVARLTDGSSDVSDVLGTRGGLKPGALEGDTHGGAVETSLMLHLLKRFVDPKHTSLKRTTVGGDLEERGVAPLDDSNFLGLLRAFKHTLRYFERESFAGDPAIATAELGAEMLEVFAGHAADALSELWTGELEPTDCHSPVWKMRHLLLSPLVSRVFEKAIGYRSQVF